MTNLANGGVSIFFIISGFVSTIGYSKTGDFKPSIISNLRYAFHKIRKIYLLHIITTLLMSVFYIVGNVKPPFIETVLRIVTNILLIQEWFPLETRSINGVAWFLCPILLFHFIFPWYIKKNERSSKESLVKIIALFILQIIIGVIGFYMNNSSKTGQVFFENNMTRWIVYRFPLSRLVDILIGCNLGFIYKNNRKISSTNNNYTLYELLSIIFATISVLISISGTYYINCVVGMPTNYLWWTYSLIFTPSSLVLVYVFAVGKGTISNFIKNKITMFLASISSYGFLISNVVFIYLGKIVSEFCDINLYIFSDLRILKITLGILITIICSYLYANIMEKFQLKR